jgi:acyl dehydratase
MFEVMFVHDHGIGEWVKVEKMVPPGDSFRYWTVYTAEQEDKDYYNCMFVADKELQAVHLREKKEVQEDGTVPQSEMSSMLSIDGSSDSGRDSR